MKSTQTRLIGRYPLVQSHCYTGAAVVQTHKKRGGGWQTDGREDVLIWFIALSVSLDALMKTLRVSCVTRRVRTHVRCHRVTPSCEVCLCCVVLHFCFTPVCVAPFARFCTRVNDTKLVLHQQLDPPQQIGRPENGAGEGEGPQQPNLQPSLNPIGGSRTFQWPTQTPLPQRPIWLWVSEDGRGGGWVGRGSLKCRSALECLSPYLCCATATRRGERVARFE